MIVAVLALGVVLTLALVFLVSRRRSRIAMWAMVLLYAVGLTAYLPILGGGGEAAPTLVEIGLGLVQGAAIALLFTPSARAWLRADPAASSEALGRTFE